MRLFGKVPGGKRHGHYGATNLVPDAYSGTYRQVFQHHPLPGAGAQEYTYSTFMIPPNNLYGAGQPLRRDVPAACERASDAQNDWVLVNPDQPINGSIGTMALLPSDLVGQFMGKTP